MKADSEQCNVRFAEPQKERELNKNGDVGKANADSETQSTRLGEPQKNGEQR